MRAQLALLGKLRQDVAAALLGVTSRTLRDAALAPRREDGTYNALELVAWWLEREKRKTGGPSPAMERIRVARAIAAERRNAIEAGKLVDLESAGHTVRWSFASLFGALEAAARAGAAIQSGEALSMIERGREQLAQAFGNVKPGA